MQAWHSFCKYVSKWALNSLKCLKEIHDLDLNVDLDPVFDLAFAEIYFTLMDSKSKCVKFCYELVLIGLNAELSYK